MSEGIANNAILMAYGVREIDALPDVDLQIGTLLALLQDDAKNESSDLTWQRRAPVDEVRRSSRSDCLCSEERADKLSGAGGRHPLLGRMYLPAYRAGTEKVALKSEHYLEVGRELGSLRRPVLFTLEGGYAVEAMGVNVVNVLEGFVTRG